MKKMAIGHHIGERAHIVEREKNVYTGEVEHREDLVNLDDGMKRNMPMNYQIAGCTFPHQCFAVAEEAPLFNREWEQKTGTVGVGAVTYGRPNGPQHQEQLALPSTAPVSPSTTRQAS